MLRHDPIVLKYPQYLPTEDEVALAWELLKRLEHEELLCGLREGVCIGGCPTSALRRFCWQAREDHKFGSECAEGALEWLSRCLAARAKLRVDSLLYDGPFSPAFRELYMSAMPFSVHGTDRQGHPVLIVRYGSVDLELFRRLWAEGEALQARAGLAVNATVLFHVRTMEYITKVVMAAESKRQGRVVDRILAIMDMGGLGMKHLNSPLKAYLGCISKESVPLFPETLHATVLANVPWVVSKAAWPIVRNFLHPVTQAKFTILSSPGELRAKLLELIAPEDVPPYFGGQCGCAECAAGTLRGGSLWTWEEEAGILTAAQKAHQPAGPHSGPPPRARRYQPPAPLPADGALCSPTLEALPPGTVPEQCEGAAPGPPPGRGPALSKGAGEGDALLIATDNMALAREGPAAPAGRALLPYAWALLPVALVAALLVALLSAPHGREA